MRRRGRRRGRFLKNLTLFGLSMGAIGAGIFALWASSLDLPDFASFERRKVLESTKIYDRTGEVVLFDVHRDIKRTVVPLDEISRHIRNATVAIEDSEFYDHRGVRPLAIVRAFLTNIQSGEIEQGGSTITQQVIKNTLLSSERTIARKIKEAILAIKLERAVTKDRILEIYLNEAPYGGSLYGVEEASLAYFGKQAKDVTLAEAAYLAALPRAPTYYSPYGEHRDKLEERKNIVLSRMEELGFAEPETIAEAKEEEVVFNPKNEQQIKAPHFVVYIRDYLQEKYGSDAVETRGLRVTTTLDWELQARAQEIVKRVGEENVEKFKAHNAGVVAINPKTGEILAMVGSRDWFAEPEPEGCAPGIDCRFDPKVNIATRRPGRQPGSAFKPFVYASAFERGYTPETVVFDLQTQFFTGCAADGTPLAGYEKDDCYRPRNYDNVFRGPVSLREALAQSINVPAVKTLYLSGLSNALEIARDFGITTLTNEAQYGLTLVLGGGEVTLLEITNAYGVFANDGVYNEPVGILRVEDREGNVLEEYKKRPRRVIDKKIARMISDVLSDNEARAPAFGQHSPLLIPGYDVAAKTGTTNDSRDAWIVGYTPTLALGAWAGNSDNTEMVKQVAGFIVAPMWNEVMREALARRPRESFVSPEYNDEAARELKPVLRGEWRGSRAYEIDRISGKLATEHTPAETRSTRVLTQVHSILHWVDKENPRGPIPEHPERDSQYSLWEAPVRAWARTQNIKEEAEDVIPDEYDDVHTPENKPSALIVKPNPQRTYAADERVVVEVSAEGAYPIERVDVFLNSHYVGAVGREPFIFSFIPRNVPGAAAENTITVRVRDSVHNKTTRTHPLSLFGTDLPDVRQATTTEIFNRP